jgi:transcriptional regulator with XRE-family HTH domain
MAEMKRGESRLRRLRDSLNLTQEDVVGGLSECAEHLLRDGQLRRAVTFSVRQYSKWEGIEPPWPHPDARRVLETYFNRPVGELGLAPGIGHASSNLGLFPPAIERAGLPLFGPGTLHPDDEQTPPPWLAETASDLAGSADWRIGQAEVELLRDAADDMDAIDQQFGGNRLWKPTRAHLTWVHHMIDRGTYNEELGGQLHAVAGKFTTSLGWFCYDAGMQTQARKYFSEALNSAMYTGDDILASRTLSNMARQAVDLNKGREAVRFARLAQTHAREWRAPNRVVALLAMREAQGHARVGDMFNCEASIKRAWIEWECGGDERDPDWTLFLNLAELTCLEGMCRLDLGQSARAQKLLAKSEALQDVARSRNRGMCLGRLSVAAFSNKDIHHSVAAATESLRLIDSGMSSHRTVAQLKIVHDGLAPYHRSREVGGLLEQIRERIA